MKILKVPAGEVSIYDSLYDGNIVTDGVSAFFYNKATVHGGAGTYHILVPEVVDEVENLIAICKRLRAENVSLNESIEGLSADKERLFATMEGAAASPVLESKREVSVSDLRVLQESFGVQEIIKLRESNII